MLTAYIDEFGHDGPFVDVRHRKFNQHPVFGYAGFILPSANIREMGAVFKKERNTLFKSLVEASKTPHQWERKGNEYFSTGSIERFPEHSRVFRSLISKLDRLGGSLFYYGDEKRIGTVKETGRDSKTTAAEALRETINRICRFADERDQDVLIIADSITDKTRREVAAQMYSHIYSRSGAYPEMRRIVEAPLHIESALNTNVQFADWICALVSRATHYQLVRDSEFSWAAERFGADLHGKFTWESKIHTRTGQELHHSEIFHERRKRFPQLPANSIGAGNPKLAAFYDTLRVSHEATNSN